MQVDGSPPLARGGHRAGQAGDLLHRITPARAGRTTHGHAWISPVSDHPRSRGEDSRRPRCRSPPGGSPPLARGGPPSPSPHTPRHRITPARAGRTGLSDDPAFLFMDHPRSRGEDGARKLLRCPARDHPRSRGEDQAWDAARPGEPGSPPLARGGLDARHQRRPLSWITPARAGRTERPARPAPRRTDHPRSRGEDSMPCWALSFSVGSPPLARGGPEAP